MQASDIKRLRELEDENRRLKQMSADLLLENQHPRTHSTVFPLGCNADSADNPVAGTPYCHMTSQPLGRLCLN
jgi:hypothetical protein